MRWSSWSRRSVALSVVVLVNAVGVPAALAAPPPNDEETGAVEIGALPFTAAQDTSEATPGGPRFCSNSSSVFYAFTPTEDLRVQVDAIGSAYDTMVGVYRRGADGRVRPIECNDDRFGYDSGLRLRARAGIRYLIMVGVCCGNGGGGGGELVLTVSEVVDVELAFSIEIDSGAVDSDTGIATISGMVTCNERSVVSHSGVLRQLREGIFVARGFFYVEVGCAPGAPLAWSAEVDTETGIAFGAGSAMVRDPNVWAYDGWREFDSATLEDFTISLA